MAVAAEPTDAVVGQRRKPQTSHYDVVDETGQVTTDALTRIIIPHHSPASAASASATIVRLPGDRHRRRSLREIANEHSL